MHPRSTVLAAIAALCLLAPAAVATTATATSGAITATLSYDHAPDSAEWHNLLLTITRNGQQAFSGDPRFAGCKGRYCALAGSGQRDAVSVQDLDGDGEPEVIVDLYTGGAHCCFVSRFYRWTGTGYVPADRNFGDPGYRIDDLDGNGVKELVTADYRFGYAFTAFAFSLLPVRVYDLRAGRWELVTQHFPALIRKDAAAAWRSFRKAGKLGEPRGAIAAWAADRYLLGKKASTRRTLNRLARQGRLHGEFPKSQRKFVHTLLTFLAKRGY
jgi:hypothetical protein